MDKYEFAEKITALYAEKKWHIEEFELIVDFIAQRYSSDELDMIYSLLSKFVKIPFEAYVKELGNVLGKIPLGTFSTVENIYLLPLMPLSDENKTKSSTFVSTTISYVPPLNCHPIFEGKVLRPIKFGNLKNLEFLESRDKLLLVDDFIGSGDTAIKCVEELRNACDIPSSCILVLSIMSAEIGISRIRDAGFEIVSAHVQGKGISDITDSQLKRKYIDMMNRIEDGIRVTPRFKFGYGQCENLVSMIKTPNNTFPFFWFENKYNKPLFKREKSAVL